MNLWVSDHDAGGFPIERETFDRAWRACEPWFRELGVDKPEPPQRAQWRVLGRPEHATSRI